MITSYGRSDAESRDERRDKSLSEILLWVKVREEEPVCCCHMRERKGGQIDRLCIGALRNVTVYPAIRSYHKEITDSLV